MEQCTLFLSDYDMPKKDPLPQGFYQRDIEQQIKDVHSIAINIVHCSVRKLVKSSQIFKMATLSETQNCFDAVVFGFVLVLASRERSCVQLVYQLYS